ncbi:MAG TPA: hypothetical protein VM865_06000 [Acidobacteriaceae bacterium]|jgi:tetratricopeptide (TPR) repeat protein|nr:hypothetical protein [Acidobacteriaceae bacterium]
MRWISLPLAFAAVGLQAQSMLSMQHGAPQRRIPLVRGLGNTSHRIATHNPEAQRYFNQGLDYIWAFNHEEARRSFQRAADLDPHAPMPLWGVALAVSPNYNDIDIGHARAQQAMAALAHARELAAHAPQPERDYIAALFARYGKDPHGEIKVLGPEYSRAMAELAKSYPNDLDASTLYAESLMDLNPWKLWNRDGSPAPNTQKIVSTLQHVIAVKPDHVGANHLLIHAVEASPDPSLASRSAKRLETLTPAAGHLVHMPAHIYQRTGNFDGAAAANQRAVAADQTYFKAQHIENLNNMYNSMYYTHNIHFLASSCSMGGNSACTQRAAKQLVDHVLPDVKDTPAIQWYTPTQPWMLVRFGKWDTILSAPAPPPNVPVLEAMWHYARASAYIGEGQLDRAQTERTALAKAGASLPPDFPPAFNNSVNATFDLAQLVLEARLQEAAGKRPEALQTWKKAVALLDTFAYNEPPDWYYPVRESLGGALLRNRQPAEAEAVFRRDLQLNPGNGRSLFGLWQSLKQQGRTTEASTAEAAFHKAWQHADTPLSVATL